MMRGRMRWIPLLAAAVAGTLFGAPPAGAAGGARIDLSLYYDTPVITPGGTGVQTLTVVNSGADATGPASLTVATPVFVRVAALPDGCAFRFTDATADPTVPEVLGCTVPALRHGQSKAFALTLTADIGASSGATFGQADVVPAAGSADVDANLADNEGWPSVVVSGPGATPTPTAGHVADLYLSADLPPLAVGHPREETLLVGNRGPETTEGPVRLVVTTPPFVRVDRARGLPDECGFLYDGTDPAVPQVVGCTLTEPLRPDAECQLRIPLAAVLGAPIQTDYGIAGVFPYRAGGSTDVDPVLANNIIESGVQVIG